MTDLDAFLSRILADPDALAPRRVFADWLADRGKPDELVAAVRESSAEQVAALWRWREVRGSPATSFADWLAVERTAQFSQIGLAVPRLLRPVLVLRLPRCRVQSFRVRVEGGTAYAVLSANGDPINSGATGLGFRWFCVEPYVIYEPIELALNARTRSDAHLSVEVELARL